jgi:hypothetical protein
MNTKKTLKIRTFSSCGVLHPHTMVSSWSKSVIVAVVVVGRVPVTASSNHEDVCFYLPSSSKVANYPHFHNYLHTGLPQLVAMSDNLLISGPRLLVTVSPLLKFLWLKNQVVSFLSPDITV